MLEKKTNMKNKTYTVCKQVNVQELPPYASRSASKAIMGKASVSTSNIKRSDLRPACVLWRTLGKLLALGLRRSLGLPRGRPGAHRTRRLGRGLRTALAGSGALQQNGAEEAPSTHPYVCNPPHNHETLHNT